MAEKKETRTAAERNDSVVKIGRYLQSVLDVASDLAAVGSIEQAAAEAKTLLENTKAEFDKTSGNVATAKKSLAAVNGSIAKAKLELESFQQENADEIKRLDDLKKLSETIEAERAADRAEAEKMIADAEIKAADIVSRGEAVTAKAEQSVADAKEKNAAASAELNVFRAEIQGAKKVLAEIQGRIDAAKNQVKSMLGGFGGGL